MAALILGIFVVRRQQAVTFILASPSLPAALQVSVESQASILHNFMQINEISQLKPGTISEKPKRKERVSGYC